MYFGITATAGENYLGPKMKPNTHASMFWFNFYLLIGHLINGIAANTEIINFSATTTEVSSLPFTDTWSVQIS